jgi:hypothetical protein
MMESQWQAERGIPQDDLPTRPIDLAAIAREFESIDELATTAEIPVDLAQDEVPHLAVPVSELADRLVNSREAFIVSLVDGVSSVEMLLDIGGVPRQEMSSVLCQLRARQVLKFD